MSILFGPRAGTPVRGAPGTAAGDNPKSGAEQSDRTYSRHMALSREEREAFLAEPHVAALGVATGGDRGPLMVPIWYAYEPGGLPWIITGANSRKMRLIRAAGCFSLLVQRTEPTPRYVSVEGPVAEVAEGTAALHREMAGRYLSGDPLERFVAWAERELADHVVVRMRPERWVATDLGTIA